MMKNYESSRRKQIAYLLLSAMGINICAPSVSFALTGGPSQPEFSSFEPVSTSKMVDEFTGDFTYNLPIITIPGPQGGEYPLSLSYHSGASPEDEASWVGYGWTLNSGAINRNTRGFPDDFDGTTVTYWNKRPKNWTATVGASVSGEIFGTDLLPGNGSASLRYNNNQGFGTSIGAGISLAKGVISLGVSNTDGESSFSLSVNPAALLNDKNFDAGGSPFKKWLNKTSAGKNLNGAIGMAGRNNNFSLIGGNHSFCTYSEMNRSSQVTSYHGFAVNVSAGLAVNPPPIPAGFSTNISGSYSEQENYPNDRLNAFGYMYSGHAAGGINDIQDYYVEKESPYNKRDLYLGAPFHNADMFSVSGEGIGGGFRLYHNQVGEFAPNGKQNSIQITNIGPEFAGGWTFGPGTDVGVGNQSLTEGPWQSVSDRLATQRKFSSPEDIGPDGQERTCFRFLNDLGGSWISSSQDDEAQQAQLSGSALNTNILDDQRTHANPPGRSSYIAYRTKAQIYSLTGGVNMLRTLSRRDDLVTDMNVSAEAIAPSAICEMAVTAATGSKYTYGLPIFAKNERNLSYGVQGSTVNPDGYIVLRDVADAAESIKLGEERPTAYASSYLLTDIQTSDYVDRSLNGPTRDDFGGYTRFKYDKQYSLAAPYHWRSPYQGLVYQRNSLSDAQDDLGTFASGDKEVAYLSSIQTKTHTAFFKRSLRTDGLEANSDDNAKKGTPLTTAKKTYKLDEIDLYENSQVELDAQQNPILPTGTPIKTVHFVYSTPAEELCQGLPNSSVSGGGKLTLKKVWISYNGLNGLERQRPYVFGYEYPNTTLYPSKYKSGGSDDVTAGYTYPNSGINQNPSYSTHLLDAWGNYQFDGASRASNLKTWVNQRPNSSFDPAAWQLKQIILPTGGEIHVQYEQDDYSYVQDKRAHAMVRLSTTRASTDNSFYLDLSEVLDKTSPDFTAQLYQLRQAIQDYYIGGSEKIAFKFLYQLLGTGNPDITSCSAEYIKGYIDVTAVDVVTAANSQDNTIRITVNGTGNNGITKLPRAVCSDYLRTQRMGKLNGNGICDPTANGVSNSQPGPAQLIRYIMARAAALFIPGAVCGVLNPSLSYFRIPMITPKKGGGLRVKRLLTFDKGLDGQPVLYGNEYIYRTENPARAGEEISSGVATTEPSSMREENILVTYLPRKTQGFVSKVIAGADLKQGEGPLGESMLPGPSVGYSRVVVRNIHSGFSNPGYSVSEFATAQKYPMMTKNTDIIQNKDFSFIWVFLATATRNNVQATQGYSFILNNMHGQLERRAAYSGSYTGLSTPKTKPVTEEKYTYFEPPRPPINNQPARAAEPVPVTAGQRQSIVDLFPGKEIDMTYAQHAVKDKMVDINFELDLELAFIFFGVSIYPTVKPTYVTTEAELATHVTTKVVRYPAIIRRIESTQDGITHTTTNLAFDQFSGQPVLTKSTDEFQGGYLQESVLAAWVHPELGSKASNENRVIRPASGGVSGITLAQNNGETWLSFTGASCAGLGSISRGDQLQLDDNTTCFYFADAPDFTNNRVRLYPFIAKMVASSAPVVNAGTVNKVRVVTSGRSNQLSMAAGTTVYHLNQAFAAIDKSSLPAYQAAVTPNPSTCNGSDAFITALQNALSTASNQQLAVTTGRLDGPFYCINMSAFADKLAQCTTCVADPSKVSIKNVEVRKQVVDGQFRLIITAFTVIRDDGTDCCLITN